MQKQYHKVMIIHPGTQHAYRLANAVATGFPLKKVKLYTWFILSPYSLLARISFFKNRIKKTDRSVRVKNYPFFELLLIIHKKINHFLNLPKNSNPYYVWQTVFGFFLLPFLYISKKKTILIVFETCGWPLTKYAKKWGVPVIMDFSAISHEAATTLGIKETKLGIKIKTLERKNIDYGLNCSHFAASTYFGKTSAIKHYPLWLGTDFQLTNEEIPSITNDKEFNCCCIGNNALTKGIDILLEAFNQVNYIGKKLYIIGNVDKKWIKDYCKQKNISLNNIILSGKIDHASLKTFLIQHRIHLHILPSRFDSFGMVVPETMSLGIPNIVSPYVGAGEMIEHHKDGFVMKKLDSSELADYINNYYKMTSEAKKQLSLSALQKSQQMTWDKYTERVHHAFNEIIDSL